MTIFNGKIHYKWPFSIAMLVYQRVSSWNTKFHVFFPEMDSMACWRRFCRSSKRSQHSSNSWCKKGRESNGFGAIHSADQTGHIFNILLYTGIMCICICTFLGKEQYSNKNYTYPFGRKNSTIKLNIYNRIEKGHSMEGCFPGAADKHRTWSFVNFSIYAALSENRVPPKA